jgi:hypothetical protein
MVSPPIDLTCKHVSNALTLSKSVAFIDILSLVHERDLRVLDTVKTEDKWIVMDGTVRGKTMGANF